MAIIATVETNFGESRELYIRVNNVDASNHGVKSNALLRGFLSKEAFESGASFMYEKNINLDFDLSLPIWSQVYNEFCDQEGLPKVEV